MPVCDSSVALAAVASSWSMASSRKRRLSARAWQAQFSSRSNTFEAIKILCNHNSKRDAHQFVRKRVFHVRACSCVVINVFRKNKFGRCYRRVQPQNCKTRLSGLSLKRCWIQGLNSDKLLPQNALLFPARGHRLGKKYPQECALSFKLFCYYISSRCQLKSVIREMVQQHHI